MITFRDSSFKYHKDGDATVVYGDANEDTANDTQYFGYLAHSGAWIIQRRVVSTGVTTYCAGSSAYAASWAVKGTLTYVAFNAL
jgi:hypothetical protein